MRRRLGSLCLLWVCVGQLSAQTPAPGAPKVRTTPEVWHPLLEQFTPAGTVQTEFGSALSEAGYRKLRAALPWTTPAERADYYFDAYDGRQFLLRTGGMPLKVRVKLKKTGALWQVSRFVAKDRLVVGALGVYLHTTESWQEQFEGPYASALLAASDDFAAHLRIGGPALRAAADLVEAAWQKLRKETPPAGLMVIDRMLADRSYRFYPRKVTPAKTRLSATLPGFTAPAVTLTLGSEPEVDANGNPIFAYELEAEADGPVAPAEAPAIALAIGRLMQQAGLTALDQQEVVSLSNAFTLRQLGR
jgi:hypothetical protein